MSAAVHSEPAGRLLGRLGTLLDAVDPVPPEVIAAARAARITLPVQGCARPELSALAGIATSVPPVAARLHLVPVDFATACGFILMWHRHHEPPVGHKFSVGVADDQDVLRGVATVGRPVARHFDNGQTLEVNRTATDGALNANSMLYGACWRAAKALGYTRLITYTQGGESGVSLRAAGWRTVASRAPHSGWTCPSRPRTDRGSAGIERTLWEVS
jgi:hypothetical protein